ncbi:phage integrase SAM-like domain-containing protein [Flavobacterium sp.]|uniref:phage integrase SAM-like domain-containing protein n=1 Tax=Flavobacterium sp. TaxID=239 RepID=UPI00375365A3
MKINLVLKGKNNPTNIYCRFKPTQINDFICTTGIWIKREDWNEKNQQIKLKSNNTNKDLINTKLRELERVVLDKWISDTLNKKNISKNWLKDVVNTFFGKSTTNELYKIYFIEWIEKFIEEAPKRLYKGNPISSKTIQQYSTTLNKLIAYEKTKDIKVRFENVNLHFHKDFIDYCRTIENLGNNSIGGHIKNIKMWCKNIELDGLPISPQYKHSDFTATQSETKDIYLTEKEIDKVYKYDFQNNFRLSNTRDLFIIGLRTGLRISDFMRLGVLNIKDEKIRIETVKTKQKVIIAMHQQVKHILEKRNGELPTAISDQKFNTYIKEICQIVGINDVVEGAKNTKIVLKEKTETTPEVVIHRKEMGNFEKWELVTSHTCRRSFATNLYGKLPNKVIMAITGHQTETQFLKYIKTTNEEFADILGDFWNKEKSKTENDTEKLKVV